MEKQKDGAKEVLPAALFPLPSSTSWIPSRAECLNMMVEQGMPPNIREHSLQVARVSRTLGAHLLPAHPRLDLILLEAGALLHDIAKKECLRTSRKHTEIGADLLRRRGYPQVAEIVAQHVNLKEGVAKFNGVTEIEIVHYADKRVLHEEIVDLQTRFEYLQERYGQNPDDRKRIAALLEATRLQELKIFRFLPFQPEELSRFVL